MTRNEEALGNGPRLRGGVLHIWSAMRDCVERGLASAQPAPSVHR